MPPHPAQRRSNSGLPGSAGTARGWGHPFCSEARRAALAAPASPPAGGPGKVAIGGSTSSLRSVLPPSIAEGGVWGAEVPPSLQDTENAK